MTMTYNTLPADWGDHVGYTRPAPAQGDVEALDEDDLLNELADAISDSLDMDWTSTDGARAVLPIVQRLMKERDRALREVLQELADCRLTGGDGQPLETGWNITRLNALRPRLSATLASTGDADNG